MFGSFCCSIHFGIRIDSLRIKTSFSVKSLFTYSLSLLQIRLVTVFSSPLYSIDYRFLFVTVFIWLPFSIFRRSQFAVVYQTVLAKLVLMLLKKTFTVSGINSTFRVGPFPYYTSTFPKSVRHELKTENDGELKTANNRKRRRM